MRLNIPAITISRRDLLLVVTIPNLEAYHVEVPSMERAQNFDGSFKSNAHLLNGNKFYGPVSFSATGERDENHKASTQNNSMSESPTRVHDKIDGMFGPGQGGILNWDGRWLEFYPLIPLV